MKRTVFVSLFVLGMVFCYAQNSIDKKAIKLVDKATEAINERDFKSGKELLLAAIGRDSTYADAYVKLFGLLNVLRQSSEIHKYQLLYVKNVPERVLRKQIWQSLAHHELSIGKYSRAREFLSKAPKKDSVLLNSIEFALGQIEISDTLLITELPAQVNRIRYQYLPVLTVDKRQLIFTARTDDLSDEDIFISIHDGMQWSEAKPISDVINSPYNEGACTISADGRTLIFTSCEGRKSFGNCDLYISKKVGDEWSNPKNMGKAINSRFWDSQPSLSADGKTLYFVSNRSGGVGGRDIWVSKFVDGKWIAPKNLGSDINTKKDETTPFIHSNNETLFFSSNGHIGMGGFDLLKATNIIGGWNIENLGFPINTFNDEVSLFITADGTKAYFAKELKDGTNITSSKLVSYDIPLESKMVTGVNYIIGTVRNSKTKAPIRANIELIDFDDQTSLYETESDSISGEYFIVLPSGRNFGAFIEKKGYLFEDISFSTSSSFVTDTIDLFLSPIEVGAKLVLENIYFDFDSDVLDQKSVEELSRLQDLMTENPQIQIEISGHTDNIGSKEYNLDLSERRAKRVYDFLLLEGVKNKMTYKGLADQNPIATNKNEIGRTKNRRIQIEIVSDKTK